MRYMGDAAPAPSTPAPLAVSPRLAGKMTRAQLQALMAAAPPAAQEVAPEDVQFAIENADLLREDYAVPLVAFATATNPGKSQRLLHLGLGALAGLVVGVVAVKLIGS